MTTFAHVALAVLRRNLLHAFKHVALLVPGIVFPLVFLVAFAGGLSRVGEVPGFHFPSGYTAFQFVFVFLQSAAFGGVFTGLSVAGDFESGFARRLLLAAPNRSGIVAGYIGSALARWALTGSIVTVAALAAGMRIDGSAVHLVGLVTLGALLNAAATLWGIGLGMRAKALQAGQLMQIPVFLFLFLAPVYVPLDLLDGWIRTVAAYNPATALLEAGRGFVSGRPEAVGLAYLAGVGLVALMGAWALTALRRVERGR